MTDQQGGSSQGDELMELAAYCSEPTPGRQQQGPRQPPPPSPPAAAYPEELMEGFGSSERQDEEALLAEARLQAGPTAAAPEAGGQGGAATAAAGTLGQHAAGPLARAYRAECEVMGVEPHPGLLEQLAGIPEALFVPLDPWRGPRSQPGAWVHH